MLDGCNDTMDKFVEVEVNANVFVHLTFVLLRLICHEM